ncbi:MAG: hypothetical protein ABJ275_03495 [Maricaulaceae bacterium]
MSRKSIYIITVLIGGVIVYIRSLSGDFLVGTTTFDHPYIQFAAALVVGGGLAVLLIPVLKAVSLSKRDLLLLFGLGLLFRSLFMGSMPIYEDDWNRYLWDGAVTAQGINPYQYSPLEIVEGAESDNKDIQRLHEFSLVHRSATDQYSQDKYYGDPITERINHPDLRTIYPPVAQGFFTVATLISPLNLDVLRGLYLAVDLLTFFLLIKTLQAYGRDQKWALLYVLNPLLIYSGYNVVHMDLLLMPPLLLTLLWVKQDAPMKAAIALSVASAVKLWPLLLAPIFFRAWRTKIATYAMIAVSVAGLSLIFNAPLLLSIGENSGLSAYTGEWERNSFLFPIIFSFFDPFTIAPGQMSRLLVAIVVSLISLYYGFVAKPDALTVPAALMVTIGLLLFLSPTGYPWYLYWVLIFLPFVPSYGFTLLSGLIGLYYVRYAMGERDLSKWYENVVVPLQFTLPLLVIGYEVLRRRQNVK